MIFMSVLLHQAFASLLRLDVKLNRTGDRGRRAESGLDALVVEKKVHSLTVRIKTDALARPKASLAIAPNDHISIGAFDMQKAVGAEVLDQIDLTA
jgi:hypothetical protein